MRKSFSLYILAALLTLAGCTKDDEGHDASQPMTIDSFTPDQGGGSTSILISGSNFSTDTSEIEVIINGHKLAIIGANTKQIMAVVPRKCGSGPVTVNIGGSTVTSTGIFNYIFTRTVTTLAGKAAAGYANGKGEEAQFNFSGEAWYRSQGITVDDNLNVYVADPGNHCVRKIDSLGNVTTLAGNPNVSGHADGQGSAAQFSLPYAATVDNEGNVYTVDPGNWDIRKISPNGNAVTLGYAQQEPWGISYDKKNNALYYVSATASGNVYRIDDGGHTPVVQGLLYPSAIDFDKDGNLYVCVDGDHTIRRYTAGTWQGSVIAGQTGVAGYANGPGASAKFSYPWGLAVDNDGNVYIAGNGTWDGGAYNPDQSIRFIAANTWNVSTYAGSGTAGYANAIGEAAAFSGPTGVTVDKNGTVYVLDKGNNRVRKIVSE